MRNGFALFCSPSCLPQLGARLSLVELLQNFPEPNVTFNDQLILYRQPGDPLNPEILNIEAIEKLKRSLAPHVFAPQYQQRPISGGSGMLSVDTFLRYDPAKKLKFELLMHSWDIGAHVTPACARYGV